MSARTIGTAAIAIFLAGGVYLLFSKAQEPQPPDFPAVSNCGTLKPGMKRIGGQVDKSSPVFEFDVPTKDVAIIDGGENAGDAPGEPKGHEFFLTRAEHENAKSYLYISWGPPWLGETDKPPVPLDPALISGFENRKVFDDKGKQIGEDSWGYWGDGERWRRVQLSEWVRARYGSRNEKETPSYGSVHEQDSELFDQIISSACRVAGPAE